MNILKNLVNVIYAGSLYLFLYRKLEGIKFDTYGKRISFVFLFKNKIHTFINLFCNPVSIVRYFEFPFVFKNVDWKNTEKYLDISSPRLFFIYILSNYSNLELEAINPDKNDLNDTKNILETLKITEKIHLNSYDVSQLPFPDQSFDVITSISVIEHIPDKGDSIAMQEMWRVLKTGGKLIITVPCQAIYEEEYRGNNIYGLDNQEKNGNYFFQRFYDKNTLKSRLFDSIGVEPKVIEFFGEKQKSIFSNYEKRWIKDGLNETIKDPLHIVRDYQKFPIIDDLPGMGVCGLVFEKQL